MWAGPGDNFGEVRVTRALAELSEVCLQGPRALILLCGQGKRPQAWHRDLHTHPPPTRLSGSAAGFYGAGVCTALTPGPRGPKCFRNTPSKHCTNSQTPTTSHPESPEAPPTPGHPGRSGAWRWVPLVGGRTWRQATCRGAGCRGRTPAAKAGVCQSWGGTGGDKAERFEGSCRKGIDMSSHAQQWGDTTQGSERGRGAGISLVQLTPAH